MEGGTYHQQREGCSGQYPRSPGPSPTTARVSLPLCPYLPADSLAAAASSTELTHLCVQRPGEKIQTNVFHQFTTVLMDVLEMAFYFVSTEATLAEALSAAQALCKNTSSPLQRLHPHYLWLRWELEHR